MNSDGFFTKFGINSPSLWWDDNKLLNQSVSQFTENETWDLSPTKVFVSVGENEGPLMVPTMMKFSSYLDSKDYENVTLTWQIFDNETHLSVVAAMISRAIVVLYGND